MALTTDSASFGPFLKRIWPNGYKEALYDQVPTLGVLPKSTDFYGEAKAVPIHLSGINGSNTFSDALANESDAEVRRFLVTRAKDYVTAKVDVEALKASSNNKGAAGKAIMVQTRAALYTMGRSAGAQIFGNGDGYIGTVSGAVSGNDTIELTDSRDVVKFEKGQAIGFYDTSGSADIDPNTADVHPVVLAVDREAGTIQFDKDIAGGSNVLATAVADGDRLYRVGDSTAGVGGAAGFGKWIPLAAPTSGDSHFGVDRSVDPVRLAGNRVVGNGGKMEDILFDASAQVMINGGRPDLLIVNPMKFAELCKSLYAKVEYCDVKSDIPTVGFQGIKLATPSGMVRVLPDPMCPYATGWLLQKNTWELCSLGAFPHRFNEDGLQSTRAADADSIAFRFKAYWNLICKQPHCNARITW